MSWILNAILSYFLFAIVALLDKYLISGSVSNPKVYTFYIGVLGIISLILIPFVNFFIPDLTTILLSLLSGALFICFLLGYYSALNLFEASKIVSAVGAFFPLFSFGLVFTLSAGKAVLSLNEIIAFIFLVLGGVLIVKEKETSLTFKSFQLSFVSAFIGALSFVLSKYVYLAQPFWSGLIWMRIGGFLAALFLLFSKEIREAIFLNKASLEIKTTMLFLFNQALGAGANILYSFAINLAPLTSLPLVDALAGFQYVFLFIFTIFLSLKFPRILKEEISKKIIFQKIAAIFLIITGLAVLVFK